MNTEVRERSIRLSASKPRVIHSDMPERNEAEGWKTDMALSVDGKLKFIRLAIFSWEKIEPKETEFYFEGIDSILDYFQKRKISVWLSNITASPPRWLAAKHPGILPIDANGEQSTAGTSYCPNNPEYITAASRLSEAIVSRYLKHPIVVLCHAGNSEISESEICFCGVCREQRITWTSRRNSPCGRFD